MEQVLEILALVTLIMLWISAGVFFAFSDFILRSLSRVDDSVGIAAMQSVNLWVVSSVFVTGLLLTAGASVVFVGAAVLGWAPALLGWGSGVFLLGVVAVTGKGNVPLNHELAVIEGNDPSSHAVWDRYLVRWAWFNHLRTVSCMGAALAFTFGLAPSL